MKIRIHPAGCILVLCQFLLFGSTVQAQTADTSIVFNSTKDKPDIMRPRSKLTGIVTGGLGVFDGFRSDGYFASFLQPNIGFEFLAEPKENFHFLFGGHFGISNPITTGISLGLRLPMNISRNPDLSFFADLGVLVFDDPGFADEFNYGARLAVGARTMGNIDLEYRLAGEWRGTGSDSVDGYRNRVKWWIGAEVGIAFSLSRDRKPLTRNDSLHASLQYIATAEEMDELKEITSDAKLDDWLERFWRIRDITPNTKLNEARLEYEKRVETANRMFSSSNKLGILTDEGRVMAIYGSPTIVDKNTSFLLFVYMGRVKEVSFATFIFARGGDGVNWEQIYSNVPGEISFGVPSGLPFTMSRWVGL
jgi:GWxTD domain-containing protein